MKVADLHWEFIMSIESEDADNGAKALGHKEVVQRAGLHYYKRRNGKNKMSEMAGKEN